MIFLKALQEVVPTFGASTDDLQWCRTNGIVDCGERRVDIYRKTMLSAEQVKVSKGSPLITCLLEGPSGRFLLNQLLDSVKAVNAPRLSRFCTFIFLSGLYQF